MENKVLLTAYIYAKKIIKIDSCMSQLSQDKVVSFSSDRL